MPLGPVTELLEAHRAGDGDAYDRLFALTYEELRRIAHHHLRRERDGHTLQTTALVHEAYLNLAGAEAEVQDRAHFFAVASRAMRHVLIDYARRRLAEKRGGGRQRVTLEDDALAVDAQAEQLVSLDDALSRLAERSDRLARVVECRFFGGMTVSETALALDTSTRTVEREWTRAKTYLHRALGESP